MAIQVNPPPQIKLPRQFSRDPEVASFFNHQQRMLTQLWYRIDGSSPVAPSTGDGVDEASANENQIGYLSSHLSLLAESVDDLYNDMPAVAPKTVSYRAITISSSYTAIDHDYINAKQRATITLPQEPTENSSIIIRNGDGSKISLIGNGKNINGFSTGTIVREGTSLFLQYFIDSNEWFAR